MDVNQVRTEGLCVVHVGGTGGGQTELLNHLIAPVVGAFVNTV